MARGFLSGVIWGGVLGLGVTSAASVLAPPPVAPEVSDVAPDKAQAPVPADQSGTAEAASAADDAPASGTQTVQAPAPQLDTTAVLDTDAPAQPLTGDAASLDAPEVVEQTVDVAPVDDAAVIPTPQALAPMAPQEADPVVIDTTPAKPLPEAVAQAEAPAEGASEDAAPVAAEAAQTSDAPAQEIGPEQETVQTAALAPEPALQAAPEEAPQPDVAPVAPPASIDEESATQDAAEVPETPQTALAEGESSARPSIGTPATSIVTRDNGVTIRRPSSTGLGQVDDGNAQEVADDAGTVAASDDPRPVSQFAQAFTPDGDKPLMAIVLIDDGSSPVAGAAGIAALRGFPYPLSFAVDTSLTDATERMAQYRKEGFEVLAMVDLPEGAQPSDAETTFGAILPQMSDIVGVLEGTGGGLQGSREVSDQVTSILLQTGHGLLTRDKGLNTMPKLARKEGVPADPIFRDFDSKGQTASVIRRFLDQAAFKAGQEGAVVMLGRMRPDTVSALLLWGLQDRAGKVSLAPMSAVWLREQ